MKNFVTFALFGALLWGMEKTNYHLGRELSEIVRESTWQVEASLIKLGKTLRGG